MSSPGAPWPCRNTCAMPVTVAPSGWATAKATSMRTTTRSISSSRIIWAPTNVTTSRPSKAWRRRSRSGSRNGGRRLPRPPPIGRGPKGDMSQGRGSYQEMQKTIREAKRELRSQVLAAVARMEPGERVAASTQACALLETQPRWRTAERVLFFAPLPEELDIWPLLTAALSAAKKVALPLFVAERRTYEVRQVLDPKLDLQVGHFGIREPRSHCAPLPSICLDLILVPGVAFD